MEEFIRGDTFPFKTRLTYQNEEPVLESDIETLLITCRKTPDKYFPIIFDKTLEDVENVNGMFSVCTALTNFKSFRNLGKGFTVKSKNYYAYQLNLSNSTNLTYDSLMSVFNNLHDLNLTYDVANGGTLYTQQLILGSTNKAKLTSAEIEIAIATNKGWTVS